MKISYVSTQAVSQAMRYQMLRMQADLAKAQQENTTWRHADVGVAIGARAGQSLSMSREIDRLKGLVDSNQLAKSRLSSTQLTLQEMTKASQELLSALTTAMSGTSDLSIVQAQAQATLDKMTADLNTNLNGEYIFAGINTDVKPVNDFLDENSPNRQAFDAAFVARFGFAQDHPDAANISAEDMADFIETDLEPLFLGAAWNDPATGWSNATDQTITSRITLSETAQTSVSANIPGVRKLAMASAMVTNLFADGAIGGEAADVILEKAAALVGEAIVDLANQQSYTGITEQRLTNASERMSMQKDLLTKNINDLEGVDPYEASTRVSGLLAQIEISYALTSRIQQLSLVRYLS